MALYRIQSPNRDKDNGLILQNLKAETSDYIAIKYFSVSTGLSINEAMAPLAYIGEFISLQFEYYNFHNIDYVLVSEFYTVNAGIT
jgi:hypothetical protein